MPKTILFDLDGTLTDSGEGIINCSIHALEHFGLLVPSREEMRVFVGPPLRDTMIKYGVPPERAEESVKVFRNRYETVGIYENHPYHGIAELLAALKKDGHKLYVATSKPEYMAQQVLDRFDMSKYFDRICGALADASRDKKEDVIAYLLAETGDHQQTIMVGDTEFDVTGAAFHGIPTIGVTWGYGTEKSLRSAGAVAIAHTTEELLKLLNEQTLLSNCLK